MKYLYYSLLVLSLLVFKNGDLISQIPTAEDTADYELQKDALEKIIVETYYISDSEDAKNDEGGYLEPGSVTYRIFADMKPEYKLISVSVSNSEYHPIIIKSTSEIFNNADGEVLGFNIRAKDVTNNTTALDSWLTVGMASKGHMGVLKSEDPDGSILDTFKNTNESIGISLTEADGLVESTLPEVGDQGSGILDDILGYETSAPNIDLTINDINIYNTQGCVGVTESNTVLIGQFTTKGTITLDLTLFMSKIDAPVKLFYYLSKLSPLPGVDRIIDLNTGSYPLYVYEKPEMLVTLQNTTGIHTETTNTLQTYPNPAENYIMLEVSELLNKKTLYRIVDVCGKVVKSDDLGRISNNYQEINISSLTKGIYVIMVTADNQNYMSRFIKK